MFGALYDPPSLLWRLPMASFGLDALIPGRVYTFVRPAITITKIPARRHAAAAVLVIDPVMKILRLCLELQPQNPANPLILMVGAV